MFDGGQREKIESKVLVPPVNMSCDSEDPTSIPSVNVKGRLWSWILSMVTFPEFFFFRENRKSWKIMCRKQGTKNWSFFLMEIRKKED